MTDQILVRSDYGNQGSNVQKYLNDGYEVVTAHSVTGTHSFIEYILKKDKVELPYESNDPLLEKIVGEFFIEYDKDNSMYYPILDDCDSAFGYYEDAVDYVIEVMKSRFQEE